MVVYEIALGSRHLCGVAVGCLADRQLAGPLLDATFADLAAVADEERRQRPAVRGDGPRLPRSRGHVREAYSSSSVKVRTSLAPSDSIKMPPPAVFPNCWTLT
jgi:hypothetical protein